MKRFPVTFLAFLFLSVVLISESIAQSATGVAQTSAAQAFTEGQRAYLGGNSGVAKEKFLLVLDAEPNHVGAKNYLKMIEVSDRKNKKSALSNQLAELIVPKVSFKEASLESVLNFLKAKATEVSEGKVSPSFVLQLPPVGAERAVTLDLQNVPFTEVLRYLGELTATKFEIQQYAVLVSPKGS